jgi:TRAP-type transport system periplasmic protein
MKTRFKSLIALLTATSALVLALGTKPVLAQDKISAVHAFPANFIYSRSFLKFVARANEAGKGVFEISVRGGPEAIGMMEQSNAVRSGVVDMVYAACAFYAATVPECDAVSASTIDGPTARKSGAYDLLRAAHDKRAGTHLLGWVDSGIRFHLWSVKEPKLDAKGDLDIKGFKVRGNAIYNAFFTNYLGAQVINVNSPEIYTALERNTIDLMGWTEIGLMDANWDKFIKHRINPAFFSTDLTIQINKKKWDSLSQQSRDILTRVAEAHEASSLAELGELRAKEMVELDKRGIKQLSLPADASRRFLEGARNASFARMKDRLEKMGDAAAYDAAVKAFAPAGK